MARDKQNNVADTPQADTKTEPQAILIRSKVGYMVHPFKGVAFNGEKPLEFVALDSWLQTQVDAGKLEVVQ